MKTLCIFLQRSGSIHRDRGGQAMLFTVLGLFTLVCFFVLTINIGHLTSTKVEMQNAADASVLSGSLWQARGLNMISMLNVGLTESLALIVMFKAFDDTLAYAQSTRELNIKVAKKYIQESKTAESYKAWFQSLQVPGSGRKRAINALVDVNDVLKETYEDQEILWNVMIAIHFVQDAVENNVPPIALLEAGEIAKMNGAEFIVQLDGVDYDAAFLPIDDNFPVEDGAFEDICGPAKEGGTGYDNYLCWNNAYDMEMFGKKLNDAIYALWENPSYVDPSVAPLWNNFLELSHDELCSNENKMFPFILADHFMDRLYYTSIVRKDNKSVFPLRGSDGNPIVRYRSVVDEDVIFGEDGPAGKDNYPIELPEYTWALATAQVYNPDPDLFNQNWHTRLAAVDLSKIQLPDDSVVAIPLSTELRQLLENADSELMAH